VAGADGRMRIGGEWPGRRRRSVDGWRCGATSFL